MNEPTRPTDPSPEDLPPRPPDDDAPLDVGAILSEAWTLLMRDLGIYVLATVVHAALVFVTCGLGLVVAGPLAGGMIVMAFVAMKGGRPTFEDTFAGFRLFGPLFLLTIVAGLLICLGLLFCVLPGVYLAIAWVFAPFLIIDRRLDFWEAMELSLATVNRHLGAILLVTLVLGLIYALGTTVVLGFVITHPLLILGLAVAYRRLFGLTAGPVV